MKVNTFAARLAKPPLNEARRYGKCVVSYKRTALCNRKAKHGEDKPQKSAA